MADFSADVSKWVEQAKKRANFVFIEIALEALKRVKQRTPVDTGYLRANWAVVMDRDMIPLAGADQHGWKPPSGSELFQALGRTIYIVNPVVYARRIEYGFVGQDSLGRHYNQKGRGMVQQTIAELPEIAAEVQRRFHVVT